MTKSYPIRILFASLVAAVCVAPSALAGWHDPAGSPEAPSTHYSVAAHRASAHAARVGAIARFASAQNRRDSHYRFLRVPADQR